MSSGQVIPDKKWMLIAGIIFSGIFLSTNPFFNGLGGALGASAAVTVMIAIGIMKIHNLIRPKLYF
jgi:hypothetical protein